QGRRADRGDPARGRLRADRHRPSGVRLRGCRAARATRRRHPAVSAVRRAPRGLGEALTSMRVLNVVGARPNFVKIAPLLREMQQHAAMVPLLVHTGQHYGGRMSDPFFADLEIRSPDFDLGVGSGSHAAQTADVMRRLEPVIEAARPDVVLVVGDVNSTLAAAITAAKLGVPIAHVEAGLRSFDRAMPEEINRRLTDAVADLLFVTE